ncbi:MAG TPA: diadenylate cyclase CdaA [Candidatus Fusicatenibacter intestinigallinarum]|uniref:Diadenylate cyclase n=1 Tax=Candidatus Fusicatenibacter intestinigallinarum TaxID=2838598 RepID=A0A9D2NAQ8_9FIRM|nr:diadenylate cyclase CdaA [Candidatus Fusicatenibacter intestinigallinarum]
MHAVWNWIVLRLSEITLPKPIEFIDVIQILLIAYFVYHLIRWVQNTKAYTLLKGILVIVAFAVLASIFQMQTFLYLLGALGGVALTALVIIFQPELRRVVEQLGEKTPLSTISLPGSSEKQERFSDKTVNEIVRACYEMGAVKTGALIVIERNITLEEYEKTGIEVDGIVTSQLLINIFEHNTPLHDGAVIIRGDRIVSATCYLPLSDNMSLSKDLGTRHRAGVGVSEATDSFTIIVSEETGNVSYAVGGELKKAVTPNELREELHMIQNLPHKQEGDEGKGKLRGRKKKKEGAGES